MKSPKSDGGTNSPLNSAAAVAKTAPLFPRLHVSETEKAGPRAPPRNKMALFEQFTVPSNRLMQPSKISGAISNQQQQFDHRQSYAAYYTPALVPFSSVVCSRSQPSHAVSSCVTSSASDQESQRALKSQTCERSAPSRASANEDGGVTPSSSLEERARVAFDDVPAQSLRRPHIKDTQGSLYTASDFEKLCNNYASASSEASEVPSIKKFRNDSLEAMSIVEKAVDCSMSESKGCGQDSVETRETVELTLQTKKKTLKSSHDAGTELNHTCLKSASDWPCQQPIISDDKELPAASLLLSKNCAEAALNNDLKTFRDRDDGISIPSGCCYVGHAQSTFTNEPLAASLHECEDIHNVFPSDDEKQDASAGGLLTDDVLKGRREGTGDSQNNQMGSHDLLELPQQVPGSGADDSPSSVLAVQSFRPKDVIQAVGQQQFWKARKALLRQQRTFSDQVFQLHKLIKVQQLLAETPGMLIVEQTPFLTMDNCGTSSTLCDTGKEHQLKGKTHATDSFKEYGVRDQTLKTGNQTESMQNPEWTQAVGNHATGSSPYMPAFIPGGGSAWGFPSLGMGQWIGQIPAQGKPSPYQPFAGAFPPGTPFPGVYGQVMLGPMPPMVPFSIPCTDQRGEPWEELSSNHGPHVVAGPNLQAASAVGHVAHDLPGAWHYRNAYYNQRYNANASEKNVSTGSGASVNNQRLLKFSHTSGIKQTGGEASYTGRRISNVPEKSPHQSENSSPSNTSCPKFKSSAFMRSTLASRKADSCHEETEQPAQNVDTTSVFQTFGSSNQYEDNGARGTEKPRRVTIRWPKCQQGYQMPESVEETSGPPFDCSGNALDLFPLVPALSAHCGKSSSKQTREDWQGRVIKAVPRPAVAASQSAAGILLSLQRERQQ